MVRIRNAVTRGDLRARLQSPKALTAQTVYLGFLAVVAFLTLPPELGRLDVRHTNPAFALLVTQALLVCYLLSASASSEIAIEGEKGMWDLAASPFSAWTVVWGKAQTAFASALFLLLLSLPVYALAGGVRDEPFQPVVWGWAVILVLAFCLTMVALLLATAFESEFIRSLLHWTVYGAVIAAAAALPERWNALNPLWLLDHAFSRGATTEGPWPAGLAAYAGTGLLAMAAAQRRLLLLRRT